MTDARSRLAGAAIPRATYRVQFHAGFTFEHARALVPYLASLGISHLYASPWLEARPGSTHGYDGINPDRINPEVGDEASLAALNAALAEHGMRQILDIVPNHMGVIGARNPWWDDLLTHGEASEHAAGFDIEWHPTDPGLDGKVLLPVLESQYGTMLARGKFRLVLDATAGRVELHYEDHRFPLDPREVAPLLRRVPADDAAARWLHTVADAMTALAPRTPEPGAAPSRRSAEAEVLAGQLVDLLNQAPTLAGRIQAALDVVDGGGAAGGDADRDGATGTAGSSGSAATAGTAVPTRFADLHAVLEAQAYRLAHWKAASDAINYRRFFDVNGLAALRMERGDVFERAHRRIFAGLADGSISGLRIDHPDGLYDPEAYLQKLQSEYGRLQREADPAASPKPLYLLVEKILAQHEALPPSWPVHGDTGYHFLTLANGLAVDAANERRIDRIHAAFIGEHLDDDSVLDNCKHGVMTHALSAELNRLTDRLHHIAVSRPDTRDFTPMALRLAIRALVAAFPVYRTYITARGLGPDDEAALEQASAAARRRRPLLETDPLDFLLAVLRGAPDEADPRLRREKLDFAARLQQFSAPVMAKAVEDTAFYRYNRLVSLNDVGGDPARFGISVPEFHQANLLRLADHPHAMLATSTHDTKRSEGVRVRINVLSEVPARWRLALTRWRRLNDGHRGSAKGKPAPSRNDEYLLYQTLLGVWPDQGVTTAAQLESLRGRLHDYMQKAVREAKQHTSWLSPQADYEGALHAFIDALLASVDANPFLDDFLPLQRWLARFGRFNTLNQTLQKLTVPGVPDIYQGCESWNLSLVDPDNRRPVDHAALASLLARVQADADVAGGGAGGGGDAGAVPTAPLRDDDGSKLGLAWRALDLRRREPALFEHGDYRACDAAGPAAGHVVAFVREHAGRSVLVVTSRLLARLTRGDPAALREGAAWRGTRLAVPAMSGGSGRWRCLLSGRRFAAAAGGELALDDVLAVWPFALLEGEARAAS